MSYWKNFVGTEKRVRIIHGKRAIRVRAIEVTLYKEGKHPHSMVRTVIVRIKNQWILENMHMPQNRAYFFKHSWLSHSQCQLRASFSNSRIYDMKKLGIHGYPKYAQWRLWSGWSESSLGACQKVPFLTLWLICEQQNPRSACTPLQSCDGLFRPKIYNIVSSNSFSKRSVMDLISHWE